MKVRINKKSPPSFPKIMIWEQYNMVAIFFSETKSVIIEQGNTDEILGSDAGDILNYVDFDGDLVLSNNY